MSRAGDFSELAGSLATVAIASLGGPVSAAGTALAEVVKRAQTRYDAGAPTRDLRRQVTAAVKQWAASEKFNPQAIELGLAEATRTVARFGLDYEELAELNFDPKAAATQVCAGARVRNRDWKQEGQAREDHYVVAERGIEATYRVLIQQLRAGEKVLLPVLQALRGRIDEYAARAEAAGSRIQATLDELVAALVAGGTVAEVMAYLEARIADWDVSVWHPGQPRASGLERRLQVRSTSREPLAANPLLTAEEALAGQGMLVVLGGPGSGKTWLARRCARQAAQAALQSLQDGADLDEVELPLFTTWDRWTKIEGVPPRQSLVVSSFASGMGHRDPGEGDTVDRLQRTLLQAGSKVLVVVDSLDEAADRERQSSRLHELTSLPGWRVMVTSRSAAWDATYRGGAEGVGGPRVVELQNLIYPDDVEAFIRAWFAADSGRGEALIRQMRARADLVAVAVVPLMLTFYCLLTEPPADAARPLPARRRELYRRLVRRLLMGGWTANPPGFDTSPDPDHCEDLLASWAWRSVQQWTTSTGLGGWGETFPQPTKPRGDEARAIDHVAPKVAVDGEGHIARRFVHRTILEHFVGEHVAALYPEEAIGILLPHLWFDPDWEVAAPAAIAAHNHRHRGELFQRLLDRACHPATNPARQVASRELDRLVLAIAEESEPGDWMLEHQDVFDDCRARCATSEPAAVARTAHWPRSNQRTRAAVLAALPSADPRSAGELAGTLPALGATDDERAEARANVLTALTNARFGADGKLAGALPALVATDDERAEARANVLAALTNADPSAAGELVRALQLLGPTDEERAEARASVLAALPNARFGVANGLVRALPTLDPTDDERAEARANVLAALPHAYWLFVGELVQALPALGATDDERAEARASVLAALPNANPWRVSQTVSALPALGASDVERAEARSSVLAALPNATDFTGLCLVRALPVLVATDGERAEARASVLAALTNADTSEVGGLVRALQLLGASDVERAEARSSVLAALPNADTSEVGGLVRALQPLAPTDDELTEARASVLAALANAGVAAVDGLVEALRSVSPVEFWLAWIANGD